MTIPQATFTNPTTDTSYRLVITGAVWRITKSLRGSDSASARLAHLRGPVGDGPPNDHAVGALIAGHAGRSVAADPLAAFAAVVQLDLERTATVLTRIAHEAELAYQRGRPGFRPRSAALRQQRDDAVTGTIHQMQRMAEAWRAGGFVATRALPAWLSAALADLDPT